MRNPELLPLLQALKQLSYQIEQLDRRVSAMATQIDEMQEEWRNEFELGDSYDDEETESETESEEETESDDDSVQSAPATFSFKVQRTC